MLLVHVLLGALWLGGVMYQETLVAAARKEGMDSYVRVAVRTAVNNGKVYPPVTVLLMITAMWMILVRDDLSWGAAWVVAAIILWVIGVVVGIFYFTPKARELAERLENEGSSPSLQTAVDRMQSVARADLVLLVFLLVLMILKPGA
ncbi:MAG: DUF2269 family protein [Acidimicrobiia bacterium]